MKNIYSFFSALFSDQTGTTLLRLGYGTITGRYHSASSVLPLLKTLTLTTLLLLGTSGAWGANKAIIAYTLTPANGSNNSYAGDCDIEINNVTWNLTGNSQVQPWRIGGKNLDDVDRVLYSKTAILQDIDSIVITHGSKTITVNSMSLIVSKNSDFSSPVSELSPTYAVSDSVIIGRPAGKDWSNCYYKIVYNVDAGSSNQYLQFTKANFYATTSSGDPVAVTGVSLDESDIALTVGGTQTLTATVAPSNATNKAVTWSSDDEDVATVSSAGLVTAVGVGTATITVTTTDGSKTATCDVTVSAAPTYTVNWWVNGTKEANQTATAGTALTGIPTPDENDCDGSKVFVGWTTYSTYSHATDAPDDLITSTTGMTMPSGGADYYAVFATTSSGGGTDWVETDISDLSSSSVFVVVGNGSYALTNNVTPPKVSAVTISNGKITSTVVDGIKWNISGNSTDGYSFSPNGDATKWLFCATTASSSSNNNIKVSTSESGTGNRKVWTLDDDDHIVTKDTYTARYLSIYNDADFRGYVNTTTAPTTFKFYAYGGAASYVDYDVSCTSFNLTAQSNNTSYGTVSVTGKKITATPASGYRVNPANPYTVLVGNATTNVSRNENVFSVSSQIDCTIQINFELTPTFTVNWYVGKTTNDAIARTQTDPEGTTLTGIPTPVSSDCDDEKKFMGWTTESTFSGTPAQIAALIKNTSGMTMPAANTNYYAVFAKETADITPNSYTRITDKSQITDGSTILIGNVKDNKFLNIECGVTSYGVTEVVTSSDPQLLWIAEATSAPDVWKFKNSSGQYLGVSDQERYTAVELGGLNKEWEIVSSTDNKFFLASGTTNAIEYYNDQFDLENYTTYPTYCGSYIYIPTGTITYDEYVITCTNYTITVVSNNNSYGTVALVGRTITATPAAGYRVSLTTPSQVTAGTATVTDKGNNKFYVAPTSDCTVQINFEAKPQYTVNWSVNSTIKRTQTDYVGEPLTDIPTPTTLDCDGKNFVGWTNYSTYEHATDAPDDLFVPENMMMPEGNKTYYAVFAEGSSVASGTTELTATDFGLTNQYQEKTHTEDGITFVVNKGFLNSSNIQMNSNNVGKLYNTTVIEGLTSVTVNVGKSGSSFTVYSATASQGTTHELGTSSTTQTFNVTAGDTYFLLQVSGACYFSSIEVNVGTAYKNYSLTCLPCESAGWSFKNGTHVTRVIGSGTYTNELVKEHESTGTVTYTSSDEDVATVDGNGAVTMLKVGTTTITMTLAKTAAYCSAILSYDLVIKDPSMEVVEVAPTSGGEYGVVIEHDLPGDASIFLGQKETHTTGEGTVADSLFFSKYFEADGDNKMIAIYNGTLDTIDLSNYRLVRSSLDNDHPLELDQYGRYKKGFIAPSEEIIILRYSNGSNSAESCAKKQEGYENWNVALTDEETDGHAHSIRSWLQFSGPMSIGLWSKTAGKYIDVIGATTNSNGTGDLVQIQSSIKHPCTEAIDADAAGFVTDEGDNVKTTQVESNYHLSTNRCLLIRKNTVKSGLNAVAYNTYSSSSECSAEITHAFKTLGGKLNGEDIGEWRGFVIGNGSDANDRTCEGMGYVGGFNYSEYYTTYDTISSGVTLDDLKQPDGTCVIEVPDMKSRACHTLKIEVNDKDGKLLAEEYFDVPIIVDADMTTAAEVFNKKVDTCKTCDVVILSGATLTKVNDNNKHWGDTARNVDVYAGGTLVVPAGKEYEVNELTIRTKVKDDGLNMEVPEVVMNGTIKQSAAVLSQRVRVQTNHWYPLSVPYPVNLSDITFSNGESATVTIDYMIRVYDGQKRAQTQVADGSNWVNFTGTTLQPGVGYRVVVKGVTGHKYRELILPMAANLSTGEASSKETTVHAWGWNNDAVRANHRGWNYVSNPYLRGYKSNAINSSDEAGLILTVGALVDDPDNDGWYINDGGTVPYVTMINNAHTDYSQEKSENAPLQAFSPFFVQIGTGSMTEGAEGTMTFHSSNRRNAIQGYRRNTTGPSVTSAGVIIARDEEKDNFGIVIGEQYGPQYDMQADLSKQFGSANTLKAYTLQDEDNMLLAFNAVHPERLTQPIPVGVRLPQDGEYTFRIDNRYNLAAFEHIYLNDNVAGKFVDLLDGTEYTFSGNGQVDNRFSLSLVLRPKTPADVDHVVSGISIVGRQGSLMLTGLPDAAEVFIYDMAGRLIHNNHVENVSTMTYPVSTGVYQVRVVAEGNNALLRTIVY